MHKKTHELLTMMIERKEVILKPEIWPKCICNGLGSVRDSKGKDTLECCLRSTKKMIIHAGKSLN